MMLMVLSLYYMIPHAYSKSRNCEKYVYRPDHNVARSDSCVSAWVLALSVFLVFLVYINFCDKIYSVCLFVYFFSLGPGGHSW